MSAELAERWCAAWETEAATYGVERLSPDYWQVGAKWILDGVQAGRKPV